ncbi:electron transport complex protein RnfC [Halospina denitrificans]|uniref:Ion-translocating oxidoreductase complex subunit C n=1 Tax=Halospina denitrificans TaxID=332522 RepID=A0A4R7JYQ8_9GAMM|nr:electron transport complex subunit RsxC [Halospina denitrificans]TDT43084.1 electron transport complex protein RnfC [Halospina denitrificans]
MGRPFDFPGGIELPDNKTQSLQSPIRQPSLPDHFAVPLLQHIGEHARACVQPGDTVLKGQRLADSDRGAGVPVHAPTSGTVTAIEARQVPHPSGLEDWCVRIEPDGRDQWTELADCPDYAELPVEEQLSRIHAAGIAGLGGAGFPTDAKLVAGDGARIRTLILNGAECEPYITADQSLMRERPEAIIAGARIISSLLGAEECLIGIEDNKPEAIKALQEATNGTGIEVVVVRTRYPSGGEKQLIQLLTGQEVPHDGIPADIGVLCQNIATAESIYRALRFGEPVISRITTLTGKALERPGNVEARIGTPIIHLLNEAGLHEDNLKRLIMGGPMMGFDLPSITAPVVKGTNCLIAGTADEFPDSPIPQPCIRCGLCEQACPMELLPQQLYWFARSGEYDKAEDFNLFDCIECGACSWVCPSSIPLVQYYQHAKGAIREQRREQEEADRARLRFEQRQARLEKEKAEKEERRQARMEARKHKASGATPESAASSGPDLETLTRRRDDAREKVDEARAKLEEARETAPEAVTKLERALNKHQKRLDSAEQALANAHESSTE